MTVLKSQEKKAIAFILIEEDERTWPQGRKGYIVHINLVVFS